MLRAAYGSGRRLAGLERLRAGSKKGVYRLSFEDGGSAILYVWSPEENYWPRRVPPSQDDPLGDADGLHLFTAAQAVLESIGVRSPRLHFADASHELYPSDLAIVEDLPGGTLDDLLAVDPVAASRPLAELAEALSAMAARTSPRLGKVYVVQTRAEPETRGAPDVVLAAARADLAEAATRVPEIGAVAGRVEDLLDGFAGAIEPRDPYALIHGELGADHVMVDPDGHPVLVDIEGLMFFDVEWEHVFLKFRFREHYARLGSPELDPARLRLYRLARHLSLVAGPLRIADGDFPDRAFMLEIAEAHAGRVLAFARGELP